jgi:hypothetical protein
MPSFWSSLLGPSNKEINDMFQDWFCQCGFDDKDKNSYYQEAAYKLQTGKFRCVLGSIIGHKLHYKLDQQQKKKLHLIILFSDLLNYSLCYMDASILSRLVTVYPKLNNDWKRMFDTIMISPTTSVKLSKTLNDKILSKELEVKVREYFWRQ